MPEAFETKRKKRFITSASGEAEARPVEQPLRVLPLQLGPRRRSRQPLEVPLRLLHEWRRHLSHPLHPQPPLRRTPPLLYGDGPGTVRRTQLHQDLPKIGSG